MLSLIFFSISQSIGILEANTPATDTIPISVPIDSMDFDSGDCNVIECFTNQIENSDCGKSCFGTTSHYFQYEFLGQQFQVYGSIGQNYADIKINLDGVVVDTISTSGDDKSRTLLYTSTVLSYDHHTIKVYTEDTDKQYEIYKFTYWPSIKSKRINFTDERLGIGGPWEKHTDNIGGIVGKTNSRDSTAQATISCSQIWVYGSNDPENGNITITLIKNNQKIDNQIFSQQADNKTENILIYESGILEFGAYLIKVTNPNNNQLDPKNESYISLSCIFYTYDPPEQTQAPFPSQTPTLINQDAFLNKEYHYYIPCGFPSFSPGVETPVKKIIGCKFVIFLQKKIF